MECLENLIKVRRSIYSLGDEVVLEPQKVVDLVEAALKECPTPFNSQSGRVVVLFAKESKKFWELVEKELHQVVPHDKFAATAEKLRGFNSGYGTILFFIDERATVDLQTKFPLYADKFPVWAEQSNGMLQYIVWTLLAEHQVGASLQHYNPLVNHAVQEELGLDTNWRLVAQMPFGSIVELPEEKTYLPLKTRMKVLGL